MKKFDTVNINSKLLSYTSQNRTLRLRSSVTSKQN